MCYIIRNLCVYVLCMNFLLITAVEHSLFVIGKCSFRRNKKSIPETVKPIRILALLY